MKTHIIDVAKKMGYKGDSNTEAECWINAVEKGLDVSENARYERANEMGFDTKNIYYHGTANHFDRFDKSRIGDNYSYSEGAGFFFTKNISTAKNYALLHDKTENKGRVLSVFLKFETPYITETDSEYYTPADRFDISGHDMMHEIRINKQDAILIKGTRNDDLCVVLDPSQILSIHAAFDPETELYEPKIDINEALEDLLLDFNLDKDEGFDELKGIVAKYCEQEKENNVDIKKEIYEIIDSYGFKKEFLIKSDINEIIDSYNSIRPRIKMR